MLKSIKKFLSATSLNSSSIQQQFSTTIKHYIPNNIEYNNPSLLFYEQIGFPNLSLNDGQEKIEWFLTYSSWQCPKSDNARYNKPRWEYLEFPNSQIPVFKFLTQLNCMKYISNLNIQHSFTKPLIKHVYWNPNMLKFYLDAIRSETNKWHLFGPHKIGKSFNLAYLSLLIKSFLNDQYRVFILHNPEAWDEEKFAFQLVQELKVTFGEELNNKDHRDHLKAIQVFSEIDDLLMKPFPEQHLFILPGIIELIKKELLVDKELVFLFDQAHFMPNILQSQKEHHIKSVIELLMKISKTNIFIETITDETVPSKMTNQEWQQSFFNYRMPKDTAQDFLKYSCKEVNKKLAEKITIKEVNCALGYYIGEYPSYISEFTEVLKENEDFDKSLEKYQSQKVEEIDQALNKFVEKKVIQEGEDVKQLIINNAYEISKQLQESDSVSKESINLDYVDLRYFSIEQESIYPLTMNVKKYYVEKYLLSNRELNIFIEKTKNIKKLEDDLNCQLKRLMIQYLIDQKEDIEIEGRDDYEIIKMKRVVASLNTEIIMRENQKNLLQIPNADQCPSFHDCVVLNEEEKKLFLIKIENYEDDLSDWESEGYNKDKVTKFEAVVNEKGFKLYEVLFYIKSSEREYDNPMSYLESKGFYRMGLYECKQINNNLDRHLLF